MKIQFFKKCAAAIMAVCVLSISITSNAAEGCPVAYSDPVRITTQKVNGDSDGVAPAPSGEQVLYDQYLSAILDVYFRNDSQAFVALGLGTAEDATLLYNAVITAELDSLDLDSLLGIDCPEELENDMKALMIQLLGTARYAVTGCELQPDGTYKITLIYEQVQIFGPLMELYKATITDMAHTWLTTSGILPSEEEMMIQMLTALCSNIRTSLENVTYAEPTITTISVNPNNNFGIPEVEEIINLEALLFDTDAIDNFAN